MGKELLQDTSIVTWFVSVLLKCEFASSTVHQTDMLLLIFNDI